MTQKQLDDTDNHQTITQAIADNIKPPPNTTTTTTKPTKPQQAWVIQISNQHHHLYITTLPDHLDTWDIDTTTNEHRTQGTITKYDYEDPDLLDKIQDRINRAFT